MISDMVLIDCLYNTTIHHHHHAIELQTRHPMPRHSLPFTDYLISAAVNPARGGDNRSRRGMPPARSSASMC